MKLKSQKASFPKLRRRQGSTCPPLVNVHPNPGPKEKSRRRGAKKETKMTPLAKKEKKQIEKLTAESMLGADIAKLIGRKEETVQKWIKRNENTGEMKRKKRSTKRQPEAIEDKGNSNSGDEPRKKPKKWKRLDDTEKGYAAALLDTGISHRQAAAKMKRGTRTLDRLAKQKDEDPKMETKTTARLGRPRKTTPRDDRALARRADAEDEPSARTLAAELKIHNSCNAISRRTISRRLKEERMLPRRKIPKPRLTKEQKAARLRWAEDHKNWTQEQWDRVLWSDESPFTIVPTPPSRKFVWVRQGKEAKNMVNAKQVAPTAKWGGGKIQVWGVFMREELDISRKFTELLKKTDTKRSSFTTSSLSSNRRCVANSQPLPGSFNRMELRPIQPTST